MPYDAFCQNGNTSTSSSSTRKSEINNNANKKFFMDQGCATTLWLWDCDILITTFRWLPIPLLFFANLLHLPHYLSIQIQFLTEYFKSIQYFPFDIIVQCCWQFLFWTFIQKPIHEFVSFHLCNNGLLCVLKASFISWPKTELNSLLVRTIFSCYTMIIAQAIYFCFHIAIIHDDLNFVYNLIARSARSVCFACDTPAIRFREVSA